MHPKIRSLVTALLVNYKLLPMAKSDFTLFGIPTRYSLFSIIKIRYNILVVLFTKVFALVVQIILEKKYAVLK